MFLCSIDHILRSAGLPVPESNQNTVCLGSIFCHFLISYRTGFFPYRFQFAGNRTQTRPLLWANVSPILSAP